MAGTGEQGLGLGTGEVAGGGSVTTPTIGDVSLELAQADTTGTTDTTVDPAATTTTTVAPDATATPQGLTDADCVTGVPSEQLNPTGTALLPECEKGKLVTTYQVGPRLLTGSALSTARAVLDPQGQWTVAPVFKGGADGIDLFNAAAGQCNPPSATCPTGQLAIVLDGRVISAPVIQQASFSADGIVISGSFDRGFGQGPGHRLELRRPARRARAAAGPDRVGHPGRGRPAGRPGGRPRRARRRHHLHGRLLPGPRRLRHREAGHRGCPAVVDHLAGWAPTTGLALTLAGITGIIVSIGVSLDSNVVYYEHLKEDIQDGRSIRSATDKSFVVGLLHHRQGRRGLAHRRRAAVVAHRRAGAGLRLLPRPVDAARPASRPGSTCGPW